MYVLELALGYSLYFYVVLIFITSITHILKIWHIFGSYDFIYRQQLSVSLSN